MKASVFAAVFAAAIGMAALVPAASAAPISGTAIDAAVASPVQNVQWRWHGRRWHHRNWVCTRVHFRHSRVNRVCRWRYW